MRIVIVAILASVLLGCGGKHSDTNTKMPRQIIKTDTTNISKIATTSAKFTKVEDTIPDISIPTDAIQVTDDKIDTTSTVHVVGDGADIMQNPTLAKLSWKVLTSKNILQDTKTKIKRAVYPEGTEDEGNTGLFISSTAKGGMLLISGLNAPNKHIDTVNLKRKIFYPGQKETFDYKGVTYTIYATGHQKADIEKGYDNYKLFLTANVKGQVFNQLLASEATDFGSTDDAEILSDFSVLFIGDIDGDNIPDILIEEMGNFFGASSLYLSSIAGDKAVYKHIPVL